MNRDPSRERKTILSDPICDLSETILENIQEAIIVIATDDFRILGANEAFLRSYSLTEEEVLGKECYRITHHREDPCQGLREHCPLQDCVADGKPATAEHIHLNERGEKAIVEIQAIPVREKDGTISRIIHISRDVTARKNAEDNLLRAKEKFSLLIEYNPEAVIILDDRFRILYANQSTEGVVGVSRDQLVGRVCHQAIMGNDHECHGCGLRQVLDTRQPVRRTKFETTVSGKQNWIQQLWYPVVDKNGRVENIVEIVRDISERMKAIEELAESERKYHDLFENAGDLILCLNGEGTILYANRKWREAIGVTDSKVEDRNIGEFIAADYRAQLGNILQKAGEGESIDDIETVFRTVDGGEVVVEGSVNPHIRNGEHVFSTGIFRDVTERRQAEQKIHFLAHYDALTGLPNRTMLLELAGRALGPEGGGNDGAALFHIDLDRFKRINDTLGHTAGDRVLQIMANRLKQIVLGEREIHSSEDDRVRHLVSRVGGDEFIVFLDDINNIGEASDVADSLIAELARNVRLSGHEVCITASIGIALYPTDGRKLDELLRNADIAKCHVKEQGRNNYRMYDSSMDNTSLERLSVESELRRAVSQKELLLHFQPKLDIGSGEIVGFEALVRWHRAESGLILPDQFIPLAEDTGLIIPLGEWVLQMACMQYRAWQEKGFHNRSIAVNLSRKQFRQDNLIEIIDRILKDARMDPAYLEIEITESCIMENPDRAIAMLHALKARNIRISVDDFGAGYSSLDYLRRLPLDSLKIDRSFISNIVASSEDSAIVRAIIEMAHSMNMKVIAEGVETADQLEFLRDLGCDEAQGFLIRKPAAADQLTDFLIKK